MIKSLLPRRKRRELSKKFGADFKPQYNGKAPITFAEYLDGFKKLELIPARLRKSPLNKAVAE